MLQFLWGFETPVVDVAPLKTLVRLDLLLAVDYASPTGRRSTPWSPTGSRSCATETTSATRTRAT